MVYSVYLPDVTALPNIDPSMEAIAQHLKTGLNERIAAIMPGTIAVSHAINYNSLPVDLSCFPLLKVYRNSDTFTPGQNDTQATIGYCLSFSDEERIPGILRWVAVNIDSLIREWAIAHRGCCPSIDPEGSFKAEYRVMSLNGEPLYSLLMFNFEFMEDMTCG